MKLKSTEELLEELTKVCGLGEMTSPAEPVSGGFMHRMYKVTTDCGIYAVKHLNPEIMSRPGVFENYARAEKIERIMEDRGIPIVPSLTFRGCKIQNMEGQYFYLFHWLEGHITDWNRISCGQCRAAGNVLGKMHAIEPRKAAHPEPELSEIDWRGHILKAKEESMREGHEYEKQIATLLEENEALLAYAGKELNRARASLPDIQCLSDEDMDPKNVMWENGCPRVIDLECLDYGNPVSHALQLALQWSGIVTCRFDIGKLRAFFDGYLEAYDNGFREYGSIFGLAYNWLDWLEYNVRRALGMCMDEKEREMGISEAYGTVRRLKYLYAVEKDIRAALDLRPGPADRPGPALL